MARLHGHADALAEAYRVGQVPPVADLVVRHVLLVDDAAAEGKGVLLHAPAVAEVVLASRSMHRRGPLVVVDEDHIIPFAPPCSLEMGHALVAADVLSFTLGLQDGVVVLAVEVLDLRFQAVGLDLPWRPASCGILATPVRVEEDGILGVRLRDQVIVDVEILEIGLVPLVLNLDAGARVERHGQVAVEGGRPPERLVLGRADGHGEGEGLEVGRHRVADAEEIADGRQHVGRLGPVPVHPDDDLPVVVRVVDLVVETVGVVDVEHGHARLGVRDDARAQDAAACLDEPQVRDGSRALQVCEDGRLAWLDDPGVLVQAAVVPARDAAAARCLELGDVVEEIPR